MGDIFLLIFLMLCVGGAAWLAFVWAVKSGQYEDIEGPKYRMLDDEEPRRLRGKGDRRGTDPEPPDESAAP
jgi:cbb3-type cytochrome oxidase maturation protein